MISDLILELFPHFFQGSLVILFELLQLSQLVLPQFLLSVLEHVIQLRISEKYTLYADSEIGILIYVTLISQDHHLNTSRYFIILIVTILSKSVYP